MANISLNHFHLEDQHVVSVLDWGDSLCRVANHWDLEPGLVGTLAANFELTFNLILT